MFGSGNELCIIYIRLLGFRILICLNNDIKFKIIIKIEEKGVRID